MMSSADPVGRCKSEPESGSPKGEVMPKLLSLEEALREQMWAKDPVPPAGTLTHQRFGCSRRKRGPEGAWGGKRAHGLGAGIPAASIPAERRSKRRTRGAVITGKTGATSTRTRCVRGHDWGLPWGPGVMTLPSNAEGCRLHSWSGSQITHGSGSKKQSVNNRSSIDTSSINTLKMVHIQKNLKK